MVIRERTFLMNFPMITSERPFEYKLAVSSVVTPRAQAASRRGIASSSLSTHPYLQDSH